MTARTVLVTGGSKGIGRAIAAKFAAEGEHVVITGRDDLRLKTVAAEFGVRGVVCDGTVPWQVAALAGDLGPAVDVLVNNAGGNTDFAATSAAEPSAAGALADDLARVVAQWRANLDANLLSAVITTEAVAQLIPPGGSVISIGSIGAERGAGSYGAAKAALGAWSLSVSAELGPRGITSNVISAGYVESTDFFRDRLSPERRAALVAATHDKRPGTTDDIAATVCFLASPGARHLTGQTIHVNGGAYLTR